MEKGEPSYTVGGNVNWCRHDGELYGGSLKNLKKKKQKNPYDPAISLSGIQNSTFLEKAKILIWNFRQIDNFVQGKKMIRIINMQEIKP